jgi:N-acetylglutamate synthase-like GNAT family acetyltransferase
MLPRPIRHRRCRRTDFAEVARLLAEAGLPAPVPDRATLHRFRRMVADLGADLYVAVRDERVVGFVHVSYVRRIARGGVARVESLVVTPGERGSGVGSSLAELARQRARHRGCSEICCAVPAGASREFLTHRGWRLAGDELRAHLSTSPTARD